MKDLFSTFDALISKVIFKGGNKSKCTTSDMSERNAYKVWKGNVKKMGGGGLGGGWVLMLAPTNNTITTKIYASTSLMDISKLNHTVQSVMSIFTTNFACTKQWMYLTCNNDKVFWSFSLFPMLQAVILKWTKTISITTLFQDWYLVYIVLEETHCFLSCEVSLFSCLTDPDWCWEDRL